MMIESEVTRNAQELQNVSRKYCWSFRVTGLLVLFFLGGCSAVSHMEQLLTLKGVSDEQQSIGEYVQEKNAHFQKLLETVCSGKTSFYSTQHQILTEFGEPVSRLPLAKGSVASESWLYHQQTQYFEKPKVTLNFDEVGNLVTYDVSDCSSVSAKN